MLIRQRQGQGRQREGRGAAEADKQAGGDQRLPGGWFGVWKAQVSPKNQKHFESSSFSQTQ